MKHKSLKHRIRARQKRTGESYSIARMHILACVPSGLLLGPNGDCAPAPWVWTLAADELLALDEHARNTWRALPCGSCDATLLAFEAVDAATASLIEVSCEDCGEVLGSVTTPLPSGVVARRKGAFGPAEAANLPLIKALLSWEAHHSGGEPLQLPEEDWAPPEAFDAKFLQNLWRAFDDCSWGKCDYPGQGPRDAARAPKPAIVQAAIDLLDACPTWIDFRNIASVLNWHVQSWVGDVIRSHLHHKGVTESVLKLAREFSQKGAGPGPQELLALTYARAGDRAAAIAALNEVPPSFEPYQSGHDVERARVQNMLGDTQEAERTLREILERQLPAAEDYFEPVEVLARLLRDQGRIEEAHRVVETPPQGYRAGIPSVIDYTCPDAPRISYSSPPRNGRQGVKVGRNKPCPCGSGSKFKKCCGS